MNPKRTCIGCRAIRDATDLVRFVRAVGASGEGIVRPGRTLPGRGAWLCATSLTHCAALAARKGGFERAFRGPIDRASVPEAVQAAQGSSSPPTAGCARMNGPGLGSDEDPSPSYEQATAPRRATPAPTSTD